ncbi:hypothetical protein E9993_19210 [Labilibacter sediminis]|nr:hypothetical protein E9993_19210 [Labilibacter sediminis]
MNKLFVTLVSLYCLFWLAGCEEEKLEFGNKELPSELAIVSITDSVGVYDYTYALDNAELTDSTYIRSYIKTDSLFLDDGTFDKLKKDTVYYEGETAKLYTLPLILLPKYKNRLYIRLQSNARWTAPTIPFRSTRATWIKNDIVAGIGDAIIDYNINPRSSNPNSTVSTRRKVQTQYIITRDSSVIYKIQYSQKSMIEE